MSWLSVIGGVATSILSKSGGIPNLPGFALGNKVTDFEGRTIWTQYEGVKREDSSNVSIFVYDLSCNSPFAGSKEKKLILGFARNSLKKLRSLRHPDILKFIDGTETETAIYIITEKVINLSLKLDQLHLSPEAEIEWKIWGLSRIVSGLKFLNGPGASTHGNLRLTSIFITQSGEWRLSGFEVLSSPKDPQPILYTLGGSFPESTAYASPELRETGYEVLKELDPSCLDSYQLYLLIQKLFNKPLSNVDPASSQRALLLAARRLASANPKSRLKTESFWQIGFGSGESGGGVAGAFFRNNRLIQVCHGLEGFSLASQGERAALVKSIKDFAESLPPEFLKFKVLPSLVQSFDHGTDGPVLLPLAISISSSLSQPEFSSIVLQPLIKLFSSPDRAMRLSLLELLSQYVDHLEKPVVVDKIWPNLLTGFTDTVPIIREATVKSVLLLAPKLSDRILNNDLLRHLAKTQMDTEPGIRTNTCILLGRLSKSLSLSTCRKVLVPAFTRSVRDPFTPARIAGLMALMATVEYYEPDDLVAKVIPGMTICLLDKEKTVRDQASKALDMFLERVRKAASEMPDSVTTPPSLEETMNNAISSSQPGIAMSATGAAGALASWAFSSVGRKLTSSELASSINPVPPPQPNRNHQPSPLSSSQAKSSIPSPNLKCIGSGGIANTLTTAIVHSYDGAGSIRSEPQPSWGGDLMDVEDDADDWSPFATGSISHEPSFNPLPSKIKIGIQAGKKKIEPQTPVGSEARRKLDSQSAIGVMAKGKHLISSNSLVAALEADNELQSGELENDFWGGGDFKDDEEKANEILNTPKSIKEADWNKAEWDDALVGFQNLPGQSKAHVPDAPSMKESKATHMAKMKQERRAKLAALKAKKASALTETTGS